MGASEVQIRALETLIARKRVNSWLSRALRHSRSITEACGTVIRVPPYDLVGALCAVFLSISAGLQLPSVVVCLYAYICEVFQPSRNPSAQLSREQSPQFIQIIELFFYVDFARLSLRTIFTTSEKLNKVNTLKPLGFRFCWATIGLIFHLWYPLMSNPERITMYFVFIVCGGFVFSMVLEFKRP